MCATMSQPYTRYLGMIESSDIFNSNTEHNTNKAAALVARLSPLFQGEAKQETVSFIGA